MFDHIEKESFKQEIGVFVVTVHRSGGEQRLGGLLLGGQTRPPEEEPGLSQHQRVGNLYGKGPQIRSD